MASQPGTRVRPSAEQPLPIEPTALSGQARDVVSVAFRQPLRTHVVTVALEDYFRVTPVQTDMCSERWYRFKLRLEANTRRTLDLLDECGARATFLCPLILRARAAATAGAA
jgi:hypothetical protein